MNQKSILTILVVVVILIAATVYFTTINGVSQPIESTSKVVQQPISVPAPATQQLTSAVQPTPSGKNAEFKKIYSTLNEYEASVNYSCISDSDCIIRIFVIAVELIQLA